MSARGVELLAIGLASYDLSFFVDEYPRENSKLETHEMMEQGGGPAANAAYLLSLWGVNCAFAGLIGDDLHGRRIMDEFRQIGTNLSLTELRPNHSTAVSVILVNTKTGSRTIVNNKAAEGALRLNTFSIREIDPAALLFDGHELAASLTAIERFPHAVSILDAGSLRPGTEELAARVRYLVASERFALQVSGLRDLSGDAAQQECLRKLRSLARRDAVIVVTLGPNGVIYEEHGMLQRIPASPVEAIDTTAAGDVFHGAFSYAILRGLSLHAALRLSTIAAGLSVQKRGGRQSIPSLRTVEEEAAKC